MLNMEIGSVEVPRKFTTKEDVIIMYGEDVKSKVAQGMDIHEAAKTILEKDMNPYNVEDQEIVLEALEDLRLQIAPHALPFIIHLSETSTAIPEEKNDTNEELPPPPTENNVVI